MLIGLEEKGVVRFLGNSNNPQHIKKKWSWRGLNPPNLMADYQFVANILNGQSHAKSNELLFSKVVSYCECKDMKNDENIEEN